MTKRVKPKVPVRATLVLPVSELDFLWNSPAELEAKMKRRLLITAPAKRKRGGR